MQDTSCVSIHSRSKSVVTKSSRRWVGVSGRNCRQQRGKWSELTVALAVANPPVRGLRQGLAQWLRPELREGEGKTSGGQGRAPTRHCEAAHHGIVRLAAVVLHPSGASIGGLELVGGLQRSLAEVGVASGRARNEPLTRSAMRAAQPRPGGGTWSRRKGAPGRGGQATLAGLRREGNPAPTE
jgi:hypothetical protein